MRSQEKENELTELENVLVSRMDVNVKDSAKTAIEQGKSKFGNIDVLMNNVGYGAVGFLEEASDEDIKR